MPIFKYTAIDYSGQKVNGRIKAQDRASVINTLKKGQLLIVSVTELEEQKGGIFARRKVRLEELIVFSRQLAALVKAGITLVKGLNILSSQVDNRYFKTVISAILTDIESGKSLSDALSSHPDVFPELYVNMIKAGEVSGALEVILDRLSEFLEDVNKLNRKVKAAFIYPTLVMTFAALITAVIFLKVIPSFKNIFDQLGASLPLPTQIVIKISDLFRKYILFVAGAAFLFFVLFKNSLRSRNVRLRFDRYKLNLPIFGKIIRKVIIARFSRTLATLLKSGISIFSALDTASKTSGNTVVEAALEKVKTDVIKGEKIADSIMESGIFPPLVLNLVAVGEETGDLPGILDKIALFFEDEVDNTVSGLTSLIEPIIIIFLGVVVGGIVISMFLPILQITRLVGMQ